MIKKIFAGAALILLIAGCSVFTPTPDSNRLKMPAIFSDKMVLQRDIDIPVWGWANPGENIKVRLGGFTHKTKADASGKWMLKMPKMIAGGPYKLAVESHGKKIVFKDVMLGDVWLCSGQSNMEFPLIKSRGGEKEAGEAKYPDIRLFMVEKTLAKTPKDDTNGVWSECSPETVKNFSGVGYFFGREIYNNTKVPTGLIHVCWGGSPIEAWMSKEALNSDPDFLPIYKKWEEYIAKFPEAKKKWDAEMEEYKKNKAKLEADGKKAPEPPFMPLGPSSQKQPNVLYNGLVNPIIPFGIKGVIWYQGESNFKRGYQYRKLFPTMIADWRKAWGQGDFPFIFVQLPNYRSESLKKSAWPELREAQLMTLKFEQNVAMAVTIDIGDPDDLHPVNKLDVGKRLALAAMKLAYGKDIPFSGPIYKSMTIQGDTIRIDFDHTDGGLTTKNNEPLKGFEIAGENKLFIKANAAIDGNSVIVRQSDIKNPAAVRYAWDAAPEANLYNAANLPASPFRTDSWQGDSEGINEP